MIDLILSEEFKALTRITWLLAAVGLGVCAKLWRDIDDITKDHPEHWQVK